MKYTETEGSQRDSPGINSFAPGGFDYSLKLVNFKLISTINNLKCFLWKPKHLTDH